MIQPLLLWQTYLLCWLSGIMALFHPLPSLTALAVVVIADSRLRGAARLACAFAVFGAGCLYFVLTLPSTPETPPWLAQYAASGKNKAAPRLGGTVEDVQGLPGGRLRIFLSEVRPEEYPQAPPIFGLVMWVWENPTFTPGRKQHISINLRPREVRGLENPGIFDAAAWWKMRGVFWRLWSRGERGNPEISGPRPPIWAYRDELRGTINHILLKNGPMSQAEAIIPAILFGDRRYMDKSTLDLFADATLIHSLALSGQHLALAGLAAAMFVFAVGRLVPGIFQLLPRTKMILLLSLPLAGIYIWLGDAPPSLLRSGWMMLLLAVWIWREKPHTLVDCLAGTILCMSVADPTVCYDLGFQLSVLCITAMALGLPLTRRLPGKRFFEKYMRPWLASLMEAGIVTAFVSLTISLILQPVITLVFGTGSPWFFLNVLWLPFVGLWVMPLAGLGLALAAAHLEVAAGMALSAAAWPGKILLHLLNYMDALDLLNLPALLRPHFSALLGFGAALVAASLLTGRKSPPPASKRLVAIAVPLLLLGPLLRYFDYIDPNARLRLIDIGQGQAVLLELPRGHRLLIDGGGVNSPTFDTGQAIVAPLLSNNKVPRIETVINSHPDSDHLRGLIYILRHFAVGQYLHNGETPPKALDAPLQKALRNIPAREIPAPQKSAVHSWNTTGKLPSGVDIAQMETPDEETKTIMLGNGFALEVLHPPAGHYFKGNNASIVLRLTQNGKGLALLPGDIERAAIESLMSSGRDLRAEVLVLPHHGSIKSLNRDFYSAVAPTVALASSGRNNSYGLPSAAVLEEMRAANVQVLNTAVDGQILVEWDAGGRMIRYGSAK